MRKLVVDLYGKEYTVYEDGTVYRADGEIVKQHPDKDGYLSFSARSHGIRTHRLIAQLYVLNPNNYNEVDHLDGNRQNNAASNLEWVTHQENVHRAALRGSYSGERNSHAKLKVNDVHCIRAEYAKGIRQVTLARKYNVTPYAIYDIVKRRNWKNV